MKGLLMKDYYIMKRNLQITCGVCAYYLIILLAGSKESPASQINLVLYVFFGVIACFLTSCSYLAIDNNKNSKSSLFIHSCPLTKGQIVFSKYLMTYILLLSGSVIIFLFAGLNHLLNDYTPEKNFYLIIFIIFSVILIFTHIELPVAMRFGREVASGVLIACICLFIVFGLMIIIKYNLSDEFPSRLINLIDKKIYLATLFAILDCVSGFLSYSISKLI